MCNKDGKFSYIDREGMEVFPCQFEHAEDISEGLALVVFDGAYGFIDADGNCTLDLDELVFYPEETMWYYEKHIADVCQRYACF